MENEEAGGFTVALVTSCEPLQVTYQEFSLGTEFGPDDVFDQQNAPKGSDYPFDLIAADYAIDDAGYEATTGWQWTGSLWGAVVQRKEEGCGAPA